MNLYVWVGMAFALAIVVGVPGVLAFFVVRAVRRHGARGALRALIVGLGRLIKGAFEIIAAVLVGVVGIVGAASTAKKEGGGNVFATPFDRPEQLLGSYNYRTHKTDDGLDPIGWYYDSEPMFGGSENRDKPGN